MLLGSFYMIDYNKLSKTGNFKFGDSLNAVGNLDLNLDNTKLTLYPDKRYYDRNTQDVTGILNDGNKVSLIDCFTQGSVAKGVLIKGSVPPKYEDHYFLDVFPRYVIFGDRHIYSTENLIHEVSFIIDDAHNIFYDFDAYGAILSSSQDKKDIIKKEEERLGRGIELGDYPQIFYYTGKYEIFSAHTELGVVSATHNPTISFPGEHGIKIIDSIRLNITFETQKTINEVRDSIYDLLRFIEVIAGRRQNVSDLTLNLSNDKENPVHLSVYWCKPHKRNSENDSHIPLPSDIPIQAATEPEVFGSVLSDWLKSNESKRNARARYSNVISNGKSYDIDRLVGAANMFDILPVSAYKETIDLPLNIIAAKESALTIFNKLPFSPERDSIFSALGRIGKATLKRKIRSRAELITNLVGDYFPELEMVIDQAVNCRNYFVHGSKSKIDYSMHEDITLFFTDALEFIFAASDLIEAGWDISKWMKEAGSLGHPFGMFRLNYSFNLAKLKEIIG